MYSIDALFSAVIVASIVSHCWGVRFRSRIFSLDLLHFSELFDIFILSECGR